MAPSSHALTATATLVILATTSRLPHQFFAWGAEPVPDSYRPDRTYVSSFPTAPSVTVAAGEDVNGAIAGCDDAVGADGYCTVLISSMPPDGKGIIVERSKTRVLGKEGVELVGSGEMAFVYIGSGVTDVVVEGCMFSFENGTNAGGNVSGMLY
jgi:hypothetical protein